MRTKRCSSCREVLPVERFPLLRYGGHCDQCDAAYCQALRHAAVCAVHAALFLTFWPVPLVAIVIIALSIMLSPLFLWSFIPLAVWAAWKLRTIPRRSQEMFDQLPAKLTDRVDHLGYLHDLHAELVRANIAVTPGIERYLSEGWEYQDLSVSDKLTIDAANASLTERAAAVRDRQEQAMFSKSPAGDTSTCG